MQLQSEQWPRATEAWLNFASTPSAAGDCAAAAAEVVFAAGARIVRTAVAADDALAIAGCRAAGFVRAAHWRIIAGANPAQFTLPPADRAVPALRVRRFSAGQWRNPRVRLAVQAAVEAAVRRLALASADASAGRSGNGVWGLIAAPGSALPLVAFGPFDLADAITNGELVALGDPVKPQAVMLLVEQRLANFNHFLLRFVGAADPPQLTALAGYVVQRAQQVGGAELTISLPVAAADHWQPIIGEQGDRRELIVFARQRC